MIIYDLKVNHIKEPMGFKIDNIRFSYLTKDRETSKFQTASRFVVAKDSSFNDVIFDSKKDLSIREPYFTLKMDLLPRTRYFWKVFVWDDKDNISESKVSWFETGKINEKWDAKWIECENNLPNNPVFEKEFTLDETVHSARIYICGLGVYEATINGNKIGDEYLAPGFNDYDNWMQYQTYDITEMLVSGVNKVSVACGDGWYKGTLGFRGGIDNIYGDRYKLLAELIIELPNNKTRKVVTDSSWNVINSEIVESGIYSGEIIDLTISEQIKHSAVVSQKQNENVQDRLSIPVICKEIINPVSIIKTPSGETVVDMGQNMVGWIKYLNRAPKNMKVRFQFGEILQNGNFYRENLRYAKSEFIIISDGVEKYIRPHFTYFGFRYIKVESEFDDFEISDFIGEVLYSDLEDTGFISTDNQKVNKLIENIKWSQKGNFVDIPTDCPQRDERLGWTGDAQVFFKTSAYNMEVYPFFKKYLYDLKLEQKIRNGAVPFFIPEIPVEKKEATASVWGDVATIIPWNMYMFFDDKEILVDQYSSMKMWVEYIKGRSNEKKLWQQDFQFGDWLALDASDPEDRRGGTDPYFISSCFYYYSITLLVNASKVLNKKDDCNYYNKLADEVKHAILKEYVDSTGHLKIQTQTALILILYFHILEDNEHQYAVDDLVLKLKESDNHLLTGFVGTPYACLVLSDNNYDDISYQLLLNEDYPSWLYSVNLGATTIWERWNSVLADGSMNPQGMNSLNHYAYGSILEWIYRDVLGISPLESSPGFKTALIKPKFTKRLGKIKGSMKTVNGIYKIEWEFKQENYIQLSVEIPFNCMGKLMLPEGKGTINGIDQNFGNIKGDYTELLTGDYDIKIWLSDFD